MANLFPVETIPASGSGSATAQSASISFGRSWRFDFMAGDFITNPIGQVVQSTGIQAWVDWCNKALLTARYRFLAYSSRYGNEFEDLIGKGFPRAAIESEVKRMASECLMADPRTKGVKDFKFTWDDDKLYFSCVVENALNDRMTLSSSMVVN